MLEESVSSAPTFWAGLNSWFTPTVFFLVLQLVIGTIFITSTLANKGTHKHHEQEEDPEGNEFQHPQQPLARSPSVLQRLKSINFYSYPYRSQDPHQHTPDFQTHERQHHPQTQLPRSPSVIQRLKSINLYSYISTEPFSSFKFPTDTSVSNTPHVVPHETSEPQKPHVHNTTMVETYKEREEDHEEEEHDDDVVGQIHDNLGVEGVSSMDEIFSQLQGQGGHFERTQSDTKPASGEVPVKLPRKMKKSASTKSAFSHFKEDDIVESRRPATVREARVSGAAVDDDEVDAKADDFINKFKHQLKLQRIDSIMRYKEMIGKENGK